MNLVETENLLSFYKSYEEKISAYNIAVSTMYFDATTVAPRNGGPFRNKMMAILSGELFTYQNDPENIRKLEALSQVDDLDPVYKESLAQRLDEIHKLSCIPSDEYVAYCQLVNDSEDAWHKAKEEDNYPLFKPYLDKVIQGKKKQVGYRNKDISIYDSLLDDFEPGMSSKKYDEFFRLIKERLIPFIQKIQKEGRAVDDHEFKQFYNAKKQAKFADVLKSFFRVNENECYMGETEHPYTMKLSTLDARITTKYEENDLMASIFSVIHEYGHALYGLQVDPKYDGTPLSDGMSMGIHESQSRLMENHIGKHPALWSVLFPKLKEIFPAELGEMDFDTFILKMNVSYPSLIRINADELTYPLHILIRYELEKEFIDGSLSIDQLEEAWNNKYKEYLGLDVPSPKYGILQDTHWSGASFGYFPTYALGSAFAAQFYQQMEKELDVDSILRNGEFEKIAAWLRENIHQYGSYLRSEAILEKVTGESFNPNYYIDYLIEKFSKVYF